MITWEWSPQQRCYVLPRRHRLPRRQRRISRQLARTVWSWPPPATLEELILRQLIADYEAAVLLQLIAGTSGS